MIEELIEEGQYQVALSRLTDMDDEMTRYYRLVCLNALEDYQRCMQEGAVAKMQANNTYYEVTALYLNALKELEEYDEFSWIDLGYVLPGLIDLWEEKE